MEGWKGAIEKAKEKKISKYQREAAAIVDVIFASPAFRNFFGMREYLAVVKYITLMMKVQAKLEG